MFCVSIWQFLRFYESVFWYFFLLYRSFFWRCIWKFISFFIFEECTYFFIDVFCITFFIHFCFNKSVFWEVFLLNSTIFSNTTRNCIALFIFKFSYWANCRCVSFRYYCSISIFHLYSYSCSFSSKVWFWCKCNNIIR